MNENKQAPVAEQPVAKTFTFEKKMGADTLTFTVSVLLMGVTPPDPERIAPAGCGLPNLPATSGESLWFYSVHGPHNTSTSGYAPYVADVTPEQVAGWCVPFHGAELIERA